MHGIHGVDGMDLVDETNELNGVNDVYGVDYENSSNILKYKMAVCQKFIFIN